MTRMAVRLIVAALIALQATGVAFAAERRSVPDAVVPPIAQPQAPGVSAADSTLNGTLLGAAIGGGVVIAMTLFSDDCRSCAHPTSTRTKATAIAIGFAGGAAVGYLIDRAHHQQRRIVLAPTVSRHTNAMRVILRF